MLQPGAKPWHHLVRLSPKQSVPVMGIIEWWATRQSGRNTSQVDLRDMSKLLNTSKVVSVYLCNACLKELWRLKQVNHER